MQSESQPKLTSAAYKSPSVVPDEAEVSNGIFPSRRFVRFVLSVAVITPAYDVVAANNAEVASY